MDLYCSPQYISMRFILKSWPFWLLSQFWERLSMVCLNQQGKVYSLSLKESNAISRPCLWIRFLPEAERLLAVGSPPKAHYYLGFPQWEQPYSWFRLLPYYPGLDTNLLNCWMSNGQKKTEHKLCFLVESLGCLKRDSFFSASPGISFRTWWESVPFCC